MCITYLKEHTFVGEAGTEAIDGFAGFAGFQLNQRYVLRYTRGDAGLVTIELDHLPHKQQMVIKAADFERWFVK